MVAVSCTAPGTMRIYLTEGFEGGPVLMTAAGTLVLDVADARTNWSTGLAASGEADVHGTTPIVVELPARGIRAEHTTEASPHRALLVRLKGDTLEFTEAAEPVRFL